MTEEIDIEISTISVAMSSQVCYRLVVESVVETLGNMAEGSLAYVPQARCVLLWKWCSAFALSGRPSSSSKYLCVCDLGYTTLYH